MTLGDFNGQRRGLRGCRRMWTVRLSGTSRYDPITVCLLADLDAFYLEHRRCGDLRRRRARGR